MSNSDNERDSNIRSMIKNVINDAITVFKTEARFLLFVGIGVPLLANVVTFILSEVLATSTIVLKIAGYDLTLVLGFILFLLPIMFVVTMMISIKAFASLSQQAFTNREIVKLTMSRFIMTVLTSLLVSVIIVTLGLVAAIIPAALAAMTGGIGGILFLISFATILVAFMYGYVRFAFAWVTTVIDGSNPFDSIKISLALTDKHVWKIAITIFLLAFIPSYIVDRLTGDSLTLPTLIISGIFHGLVFTNGCVIHVAVFRRLKIMAQDTRADSVSNSESDNSD